MFIRKILLVILIITILPNKLQSGPEVDWFESVKTPLHYIHSTVLLQNRNTDDSDEVKDELFGKIMGSMPSETLEMNDEEFKSDQLDYDTVFSSSSSSLYIYFAEYSGENVQIYKALHYMHQLSIFSTNCYFLIILKTSSNSNNGIEDILRYSWKEKMVNVVIVEIRLARNVHQFIKVYADNPQLLNCRNGNCKGADDKITNTSSRVIVHQFNPFINELHHKKFSPRLELFPNFVKNMHGHQLAVVFFHQPPFSIITRNKNNQITSMSGANFILMQTLAKQLNFTPNVRSTLAVPGGFTMTMKNFTAEKLISFLHRYPLDIMAILTPHLTNKIMEESQRSQTIIEQEMGVLMPIKFVKKIPYHTFESSALTLVIVMIFWFAVILLKFDDKIWDFYVIFCMILSLSVRQQPSRAFERILFLFIVILGFMYSNDIYASLTKLAVDSTQEDEYITLDEIINSGLTPIVRGGVADRTFQDAAGVMLNLKKITSIHEDNTDCPSIAMVHRNVCCLMYRTEAEYYRQLSRDNNGQYRLKFARPIVWSDHGAFLLQRGSPYKENINRIIQKCTETGHVKKWYSDFSDVSRIATVTEVDERGSVGTSQTLRTQLMVVVVVGHSFASLVFIGELLIHRFGNPFKIKSILNLLTPK